MQFDAAGAVSTMQAGFAALSALVVSYSLSAIGAVILLVAGYLAAGLAERSLAAALGGIRGMDQTLITFFSKIARYAILGLVLVMVLGQFGVQTASIIAAMGAIGLAIGLALQGTLQNIAAGVMLLVLRPLRIGEFVEVDTIAGTVEEIGLFASRLRAPDGVYILAPNSTLWNKPIRNYNRNKVRRRDIEVSIGDGQDIALAQKTLVDLARRDRRVLENPAPEAFVSALGEDSVTLTLRYWTSDRDVQGAETSLRRAAKEAFQRQDAPDEPDANPSSEAPAKASGRKAV
ncbi:mechanosensitive ion channel family protein [Mesorhizobium sp. J428]|uniref:mechanosensitive ion channel family protein n=1 Tax=Mesorhizobium sp. J428 TaxID=2898440 RepID=UPI002151BA32|nr:mechanosensitive ion channel family protein [Mesorhizobium sp. J428]MCR5856604.1 mechanosensitive ion channel family protein [Mesorhizobium sp. J428]